MWMSPASASGVVVTISPNSSSSSPQTVDYVWTRTSATTYAAGTTITLTVYPAMLDVTSTSFYVDLDGDTQADATYVTSTNNSITFLVGTTTASVSTFNIHDLASAGALQLTFSGTAQNYSIAVFTSSPTDFGAALFYANGGNLVNVTANVPSTLVFSIRNSADTANTNTCDLGSLSALSTSTCSYRLRLELTNAANGFVATIQGNHDLASGNATITAATNDGYANAGTEGYGISELVGATAGGRDPFSGLYDQPVVESSEATTTFNVDVSPVPTTTYATIISYGGAFSVSSTPSLTGTTLVTHFANITAATPAGNYSQTVTYLVTASF